MIKQDIRNLAIKYRKDGYSYSIICNKLNLSKSTVCYWLKDIPYSPNSESLDKVKNGSRKSSEVRHNKKILTTNDIRKFAVQEIGDISERDLSMFGLGLYLGEGAKSIESVRIINSDPKVIKISIQWFTRVLGVGYKNMKLSVHTYPGNNVDNDIHYWSEITKIPVNQFSKTQVDTRKGKVVGHKLPHGTVQLRVIANGDSRFGVNLHRKIIALTEAVIAKSV